MLGVSLLPRRPKTTLFDIVQSLRNWGVARRGLPPKNMDENAAAKGLAAILKSIQVQASVCYAYGGEVNFVNLGAKCDIGFEVQAVFVLFGCEAGATITRGNDGEFELTYSLTDPAE